jgi:hypothetical protein
MLGDVCPGLTNAALWLLPIAKTSGRPGRYTILINAN